MLCVATVQCHQQLTYLMTINYQKQQSHTFCILLHPQIWHEVRTTLQQVLAESKQSVLTFPSGCFRSVKKKFPSNNSEVNYYPRCHSFSFFFYSSKFHTEFPEIPLTSLECFQKQQPWPMAFPTVYPRECLETQLCSKLQPALLFNAPNVTCYLPKSISAHCCSDCGLKPSLTADISFLSKE